MMRTWLIGHFQALQRAIRKMTQQPGSTVLSTLVIGIALALPLGLFALLDAVVESTSRIDADPHINVYLQVSAGNDDAKVVEARLRADPRLKSVKFVPRDDAFREMKNTSQLADLLAGLDTNPLPHAFSLQPKSSAPEELAQLRTDLAALPRVEHVLMDFEWAQKLAWFANFAEHLILLLGLVLAAAVVVVTGNTIRLQILTQREEIEVSRLIGATRRFIRRPFLYFGLVQGCLAGTVALVIVIAGLWWISREVQALTVTYGYDFTAKFLTPTRVAATLAGASLLGWLGAFVSVAAHFSTVNQPHD